VLRVLKELLVQQVHKVLKVAQVLRELKDRRVLKVLKVVLVQQVQQVLRVAQVLKELKDRRVQLELKVLKVFREQQDLQNIILLMQTMFFLVVEQLLGMDQALSGLQELLQFL